MKIRILLIIILTAFIKHSSEAQGFYFGLKGGLLIGTQSWNNFDRDPLIKFHGIAFIESYDEAGDFSLFAQAGLHQKGSAIRGRNFISLSNGETFRPPSQAFVFNNISLTMGGKKKHVLSGNTKWHYMFGMRGDYNISTNLDEYEDLNEANGGLFFPSDVFVKDITYGVTMGGGLEFSLSEFVGALVEFTVNPDFSFQYKQPEINNVYIPYTGTNGTIRERTIRNITFEITVGFRFLRKVIYVD